MQAIRDVTSEFQKRKQSALKLHKDFDYLINFLKTTLDDLADKYSDKKIEKEIPDYVSLTETLHKIEINIIKEEDKIEKLKAKFNATKKNDLLIEFTPVPPLLRGESKVKMIKPPKVRGYTEIIPNIPDFEIYFDNSLNELAVLTNSNSFVSYHEFDKFCAWEILCHSNSTGRTSRVLYNVSQEFS